MTKTYREVVRDIKKGEVWENKRMKIYIDYNNKLWIVFKNEIKIDYLGIMIDLDDMFTLRKIEYDFSEAFNAYENNNLEIESSETGYRYKKLIIDDVLCDCMYIINNGWKKMEEFDIYNFSLKEIRGKWYIND